MNRRCRNSGYQIRRNDSWRNTEPRDERIVAASSAAPIARKVPRRNFFIELFRQDVVIVL